jgi:hypothetical protein
MTLTLTLDLLRQNQWCYASNEHNLQNMISTQAFTFVEIIFILEVPILSFNLKINGCLSQMPYICKAYTVTAWVT